MSVHDRIKNVKKRFYIYALWSLDQSHISYEWLAVRRKLMIVLGDSDWLLTIS